MVAVSLRTTSSNGLDETMVNLRTRISRVGKPPETVHSPRGGWRKAIVQVSSRSSVDQQTEQLRPAVVAARVHQLLALVDQREVEIGDHHSFTRADRLAQQDPSGATIAVKQPPEIGPILQPVSFMICAC